MELNSSFLLEGPLLQQLNYLSSSSIAGPLARQLKTDVARRIAEISGSDQLSDVFGDPSVLTASSVVKRINASNNLNKCKELVSAEGVVDNLVALNLLERACELTPAPMAKFTQIGAKVCGIMTDKFDLPPGLKESLLSFNGESMEALRTSWVSSTFSVDLSGDGIVGIHQVPLLKKKGSGQPYTCDVALATHANPYIYSAIFEGKNVVTAGTADEAVMCGIYLLQAQGTAAVFLLVVEGAMFSCELLQRTTDCQYRRTKLCNTIDSSTPANENLLAAWIQVMSEFITAPSPSLLRCGKSVFVDQAEDSFRLRNVVAQGEWMYKVYDRTQVATLSLAAAEAVYRTIRLSMSNEHSPAPSPAGLSPASSTQLRSDTPSATPSTESTTLPTTAVPASTSAGITQAIEAAAKVAVQRAQQAAALHSSALGEAHESQASVAAALAAQQSLEAALKVARLRQGAAEGYTMSAALQIPAHNIHVDYMDAVFAAEMVIPSSRINLELMKSFYPGPTELVRNVAGLSVVRFRRVFSESRPLHLPCSEAQVREFVRLVLSMHERGYILGDLRPANVLYADSGEVYLIDFDLARPVSESAAYPYSFRTAGLEISRHGEAVPGIPMRKEHDLYALSECLRYYARQRECPGARAAGAIGDERNAAAAASASSAAATRPDAASDCFDMQPLSQELGQM